MRVLLDECLPRRLARELVGHEVSTVSRLGWAGIRNGELLRRAQGKFEAVITIDKLFGAERIDPQGLILVTLRARSNRIESLLPLVPEVLRVLRTARFGEQVDVGS